MTKKNLEIQQKYDKTAPYYDERYKLIQFTKYFILFQTKKFFILERNHNGIHELGIKSPILDFGGGTGLFYKFLLKFIKYIEFLREKENSSETLNLENIEDFYFTYLFDNDIINKSEFKNIRLRFNIPAYIISDISFEMLCKFKDFCHENKSPNVYGIIASDGEYCPFRDNEFKGIYSFTALQNLGDFNKAIKEIKRILAINGDLGISILKKESKKLSNEIYRKIIEIFSEIEMLNTDIVLETINEFLKIAKRKYFLLNSREILELIENTEDIYLYRNI